MEEDTIFMEKLTRHFSSLMSPKKAKPENTGHEDDSIEAPPAHIIKELPNYGASSTEKQFYSTLIPTETDPLPPALKKQILKKLKTTLESRKKREVAIPRLPSVIPKLLQSLRDPDASAKDFVQIINKDPALSGSVLKLASSAYFNPLGSQVSSIENAVVKLGLEGLRTVLSTIIMQPVIRPKSNHHAELSLKLWAHSIQCAVACEIIAKHNQLEPFKAYLMGLVHDIGKITIFNQIGIQLSTLEENTEYGYSVFTPLIQNSSAPLSATIAKDWNLPNEILIALREQSKLAEGSSPSAYGYVLFQANLICEIHAIASEATEQKDQATEAVEQMGLPESIFEKLDSITADL